MSRDSAYWIVHVDECFLPLFRVFFQPSFNANVFDDEAILFAEAKDEFGNFGDSGRYNKSYYETVRHIRRLMDIYTRKEFFWSDVDILFYRSPVDAIREESEGADIVVMLDRDGDDPIYCTGLMRFVASPKVAEFFDLWIAEESNPRWANAQDSFNHLARENRDWINVKGLSRRFWSIGLEALDKFPWEPGDRIPSPPSDIVLHHANFTLGVKNKIELIAKVLAAKI